MTMAAMEVIQVELISGYMRTTSQMKLVLRIKLWAGTLDLNVQAW